MPKLMELQQLLFKTDKAAYETKSVDNTFENRAVTLVVQSKYSYLVMS